MAQSVLTEMADITRQSLSETSGQAIDEGQARLAIRSFALTANNVTYAATGDVIGYWRFFPTGMVGKGIVPVWGVAEVVESRSDVVTVGQELYGFYPMAEEWVITPRATSRATIIDASPHRADLPAVYNAYMPLAAGRPRGDDHLRALLQPLIATSYLLYDWLLDNDLFGARQVIVGSASSKTGLGLMKFLAGNTDRSYRIIGLTSPGNCEFVAGLNACDQVVTYDAVETVDRVASVYVDMAGDAEVKKRLHHHLGAEVRHSAAVGTSHWDRFAPPEPMPGAKPRFFFAPAQIAKRREEWGPGVIEARIEEATMQIVRGADQWLSLRLHGGLEGAMSVYSDIADGKSRPSDGHIIEL